METYHINFNFTKFIALQGSEIYESSEQKFGSNIYFKEYWKVFDKDLMYLGSLVRPSKDLSFCESIKLNKKFMKEIFRRQMRLNNNFYNLQNLVGFNKSAQFLVNLYRERCLNI